MLELETQAMVDHYIVEMKAAEAGGEIYDEPDALDTAAVWAFSRYVDGMATVEDLHAYRAWITRHRMTGIAEADLKTSVAVADALARKLGVA
jgi:hypothetical protein